MFCVKLTLAVLLLFSSSFGLPSTNDTSQIGQYTLTNLFQNDLSLNYTSAPSFLLVSPSVVGASISSACSLLGEVPVSFTSLSTASQSALFYQLQYQISPSGAAAFPSNQQFWVSSGAGSKTCNYVTVGSNGLKEGSESCSAKLPVICSQTAPYNIASEADTSSKWSHSVSSNGVTFTG
jgi:hypothetical protein